MQVEGAPQVGVTIAQRYQLLDEIGRGGFGVIFRAHDLQEDRELALKVVHGASTQLDQQQLEQRFEREALMASALRHPHSIRQFDHGRCPSCGALYIAMELLHGETLAERIIRTGTFDAPLVARVARGVLRALSAAHTLDIVHRDLKPANIMLCEHDGEEDFVKVLDFGIAKTMVGNHDITSAGMTLGSPTYMPPELLLGKAPVPASDLYSLGLTLAETIIGSPLVQGATPLERARAQIAPTALPAPEVLVRHPLWPWLSGALAKDVDQRYANADAMLRALDQVMPPPFEPATIRVAAIGADATMELPSEPSDEDEDAESATMVMEALPAGMLEQFQQGAGFAADATIEMEFDEATDTNTDMMPLYARLDAELDDAEPDDATEMMENPLEMLRQMQEQQRGPLVQNTPNAPHAQPQQQHAHRFPVQQRIQAPTSEPTPAPSSQPRPQAQRPTYPTAPPQVVSRGFGPSADVPPQHASTTPQISAPMTSKRSSKPAWLTPLNIVVAVLCAVALVLLMILLLR